jgi:hypothetical protein
MGQWRFRLCEQGGGPQCWRPAASTFQATDAPPVWTAQDLLKEHNVPAIPGVTSPMTYIGMWKARGVG